jgi:hypothetical protein
MTPSKPHRIFLLSPANAGGERARMLLNERAEFDLAVRLRQEGAPLGEAYAFMSGLYFRGKIAYSKAFATPPAGTPGALVITPGRGLVPPDKPVTVDDLRAIATVRIEVDDPLYRAPLERDAQHDGMELNYVPALNATRHGSRPPKLPKWRP